MAKTKIHIDHLEGVQPLLTLTTTGTSGAATLTGATLNIPQYAGGGSVADATTTVKGIVKLAGDLGGTADLPTTPTAIRKTGNETKTGSLQVNGDVGIGVYGTSTSNYGVYGTSDSNLGGYFSTNTGTKIASFVASGTEQAYIEANGSIVEKQYKISALNTAPSNATATRTLGEIRYDTNYIYVCVATNTWKR